MADSAPNPSSLQPACGERAALMQPPGRLSGGCQSLKKRFHAPFFDRAARLNINESEFPDNRPDAAPATRTKILPNGPRMDKRSRNRFESRSEFLLILSMPPRKEHRFHTILTGWLLLLAAFFSGVTDIRASIEVEHTHVEGHHQHECARPQWTHECQ